MRRYVMSIGFYQIFSLRNTMILVCCMSNLVMLILSLSLAQGAGPDTRPLFYYSWHWWGRHHIYGQDLSKQLTPRSLPTHPHKTTTTPTTQDLLHQPAAPLTIATRVSTRHQPPPRTALVVIDTAAPRLHAPWTTAAPRTCSRRQRSRRSSSKSWTSTSAWPRT